MIAHRLSTVRNAGSILVMEPGRVVEWIRHEELMHRTVSIPTCMPCSFNERFRPARIRFMKLRPSSRGEWLPLWKTRGKPLCPIRPGNALSSRGSDACLTADGRCWMDVLDWHYGVTGLTVAWQRHMHGHPAESNLRYCPSLIEISFYWSDLQPVQLWPHIRDSLHLSDTLRQNQRADLPAPMPVVPIHLFP